MSHADSLMLSKAVHSRPQSLDTAEGRLGLGLGPRAAGYGQAMGYLYGRGHGQQPGSAMRNRNHKSQGNPQCAAMGRYEASHRHRPAEPCYMRQIAAVTRADIWHPASQQQQQQAAGQGIYGVGAGAGGCSHATHWYHWHALI
jgi:hypothetical protein